MRWFFPKAIIVLCLAMAGYAVFVFFKRTQVERKIDDCRSLKLGMTADRVRQVLGQPKEIFIETAVGSNYELWLYDLSADGSSRVSARFDPASQLLTGFQCSEGEFVLFDDESIARFGVDSLLKLGKLIESVKIGQHVDSLIGLLRSAKRSYILSGSQVWQFHGILTGDGCPCITVDSATNRVTMVNIGTQYFLSEAMVSELLASR